MDVRERKILHNNAFTQESFHFPPLTRDLTLWRHYNKQCCGSMTFWGGSGSGSADPCLWLMDLDPAIFVTDLQDAIKKLIFSANYFLKLHLHNFSKIKSQKESQNSRNQGFSYYFCMIIEGSGSARPKNMWIRIRNTDNKAIYRRRCRLFPWTLIM